MFVAKMKPAGVGNIHIRRRYELRDGLGNDTLDRQDAILRVQSPRDNLFSLFAIANDVQGGGKTGLLHVDYSDSIATVSTNYTC